MRYQTNAKKLKVGKNTLERANRINERKLEKSHGRAKILVIGDGGVGKSCIIQRLVENNFTDKYITPPQAGFRQCMLTSSMEGNIEGNIFELRNMNHRCGNIDTILWAYDTTDCASFEHLEEHLMDIREYAKGKPVVLVGTKSDLSDDRKVSLAAAQEFATKNNLPFVEVSAKTGDHIKEAFVFPSETVVQRQRSPSSVWSDILVQLIKKFFSLFSQNAEKAVDHRAASSAATFAQSWSPRLNLDSAQQGHSEKATTSKVTAPTSDASDAATLNRVSN